MGRRHTRAADNPFCQARLEAAKHNDKLLSKEGASEMLGVTRTRARSGKGTLNIAQFMDGEWTDCSKEKYADTQQEILNTVGMDRDTFQCVILHAEQGQHS